MTFTDFAARFPSCNTPGGHYALDLTDDERVAFYRNAAGEVGEAREDRGTTVTVYSLLGGETADMVVAYYEGLRAREHADRLVLDRIAALLVGLSDEGRRTLRDSL
jgi:hypothetical protein